MPDQIMIERAKGHLAIARYLLSKADERGKTHGEKHHFMFVCLAEIACAQYDISDNKGVSLDHYENTDPQDVGEIPF
jgi:hypothetical protein